jgi:hypothetical protein
MASQNGNPFKADESPDTPKKHFFAEERRVARWHIFKPKIPIWVNFWRVLKWKRLEYFMAIRPIVGLFGIFCSHVLHLWSFERFLPIFGMLYEEKSGNPGRTFRKKVDFFSSQL